MRGIFYNSSKSVCSIWESGLMCYNALKKSEKYTLDYSEGNTFDYSYDFAIVNQHYSVNNWINENIIKQFNKPIFCIVTEVSFSSNPIEFSAAHYTHYIVLDSTIDETEQVHAFGRPVEDYDIVHNVNHDSNKPSIFSFGFATPGKDWHKIVELVQQDYDDADIHFNIPKGTYVPHHIHNSEMSKIYDNCKKILTKPGIQLKITSDVFSKEELIKICSTKTINCFYYDRHKLGYKSGLAAVTDQAISAGRPLFVTGDCTFRHIHKYIPHYPNISIKEAIEKTQEGVLAMKKEWSSANFTRKFEKILLKC